jgi:TldD protein
MLQSVPVIGRDIALEEALMPIETALKKRLADVALNAARSKGATYADVRIGRYLNQFLTTRENRVENISNTESYGMGIRVIANGSWGFASIDQLTEDNIARAAATAVQIAKVNSKLLTEPVKLAPQRGYGEVSWKTPIEKNAFEIPIKEKTELLLAVNDAAMKGGANYINSSLFLVNEQKYFASTEGSYIDQDVHRLWPTFTVTKIDPKSGKFETRNSLSSPMGMGYEYLNPKKEEEIDGLFTIYKNRYNMLEDVTTATRHVDEKLRSKPVEAGKYDLVIDPTNLFLTIHESVGHPSELDRVLGEQEIQLRK